MHTIQQLTINPNLSLLLHRNDIVHNSRYKGTAIDIKLYGSKLFPMSVGLIGAAALISHICCQGILLILHDGVVGIMCLLLLLLL